MGSREEDIRSNLKVIHLLDSVNRGGKETLVLDVCKKAQRQGIDVTLVTMGVGDLQDEIVTSHIDYISLRRKGPLDFGLVSQLRRLVLQRQIGVVHSHQAVEALHAYLATVGTNARLVLSYHGYAHDMKDQLVLRFLAPRMHANVAVSKTFLDILQNTWYMNRARNFHVLHNGIDSTRLKSSRKVLKDELALPKDVVLGGMLGSFAPRKDQMTVCKALPVVFGKSPSFHFAFIGGWIGEDRLFYDSCVQFCREHGIADRVHFVGKRRDVPDVLHSLDLFVLSSKEDTFGMAAVEAMLMGLPVICSDIPPLREISGGGKHAYLFAVGDAASLAETLLPLLQNQSEQRRMGAEARDWALSQFTIERHIESLKAIYSGILSSR